MMTFRTSETARAGSEFRLQLVLEDDPGRNALEQFLRERYARAFDARLTEFMPWLVEMRNSANARVGAVGLRAAAAGPLFLEQYLTAPAERAISDAARTPAARIGMVELGNFAADSPGALRQLIVSLVYCLHGAGFDWALFTLLPAARNTFARLGLRLIPLTEARPDHLAPAQRAAWGRYYEQQPWVMAGRLADGIQALEERTAPRCLPSSLFGATRIAQAWA